MTVENDKKSINAHTLSVCGNGCMTFIIFILKIVINFEITAPTLFIFKILVIYPNIVIPLVTVSGKVINLLLEMLS